MRTTTCAVALVALMALPGCALYTSRVDATWGSAQSDTSRAQIANPAGVPADSDPGTDMDGATVQTSMDKFRREQRKSQASPPAVINIGAGGR